MTSLTNCGLTRRALLRLSGLTVLGVFAACAPAQPTAVPTPVEKATTAPKDEPAAVTEARTVEEIVGRELMPGSPDHPKGWRTTLPDPPPGVPWDPPIVITQSLRVDAATKFSKGDDINNSQLTRFYKKLFGIEYKCPWTWVQGDERAQKYNVAMASGDLPDICSQTPADIFAQMLEAGMVQDYTEIWDTVASPQLKEAMEWGDHSLWAYVEIDGRKMAYPTIELAGQNDKVLFYRKDWLDKVGMPVPTTIDELGKVALAFREGDLGQGAKGTTIGLLASNMLSAWYGGVDPIFGAFGVQPAYHDTPGYFTDDGEGGLRYDGTRPEMKEALSFLRQWFADGVLSEDFFTLAVMDSAKLVAGNNCGLLFSPSNYGLLDSVKNDPAAEWAFADIPTGPGGQKGKYQSTPAKNYFPVFRKGFEHVDKVLMQANWEAEFALEPERRMHGWEGYNYEWEGDKIEITNSWTNWSFGVVHQTGSRNVSPLVNVNEIKFWYKYRDEVPREKWDAYMELLLDDPTGVRQLGNEARLFEVERTLIDGIPNRFVAPPTPTMVERWASLQKLVNQTYFGIITGDLPLDDFERFVSDWRTQGGDRVLQEVNDWWAAQPK